MAEDEGSEKPFEATPRKLEEARKRGDFPVSQDLVTFGVYLGVLAAGMLMGLWSINQTGLAIMPFIAAPDLLAAEVFGGNGRFAQQGIFTSFSLGVLAWFLLPFVFALSVAFLQGALVFAGQKLQPKLNRVSPIKNAKQKYGPDGLFNFAKSAFKLGVYSIVLALVFRSRLEEILNMPALPVAAILELTVDLCFRFLVASAAVIFAIAVIDFAWQRSQFLRRQRMSLKELKDELKETEGDPHTKQARRQKAHDIATNRMLADVPGADVVVVNPEHYAVALKWIRLRGTAPTCVAKGVDAVADRIREVAGEHGVPIYRDPPTARALFATVDIGEEIPVEHYQAIAAAIRFADAMRAKARGAP
ncbi:MAG: flagellar type III secretion system protein FlhB [Paracoccaceae bacterium]|nr:flagellar type III secretion system protein FlhB [Paracoccaceae bacterium]